MKQDYLYLLLLALSFLTLFGAAELLYHKAKVKAELTRKLVHTGTGLLTMLFPVLLRSHWHVMALCGSFAIILVLSLQYNLLPSINAIDRKSVGSLAFPASVYACFLAFDYFNQQYVYFYLPILTLAVCDPMAALAGKKWPLGVYTLPNKEQKTMMGSTTFFVSGLLLFTLMGWLLKDNFAFKRELIGYSLILVLATIAEARSGKGFDNITIPAAVLIGLMLKNQVFI